MKKIYKKAANKSGVYKIINGVNGKIYIGSCKRFKQRASEHHKALLKQKHHNRHLQRAWNKHGGEAFVFEVIEVVDGDKLTRTTREEEILMKLKVEDRWEECYNFTAKTTCKKGPWSNTPEVTRKRHSEAMTTIWQDPEHRMRISKAITKSWESPGFREKIKRSKVAYWTKENRVTESKRKKKWYETADGLEVRRKIGENTRNRWQEPGYRQRIAKKISKAKKTQWSDETFKAKTVKAIREAICRPVQQIDKKTGEVLATYATCQEAMVQTGVNFRNVSAACIGKQKTAGGFKWRYANN